jgi:hypothetical protein
MSLTLALRERDRSKEVSCDEQARWQERPTHRPQSMVEDALKFSTRQLGTCWVTGDTFPRTERKENGHQLVFATIQKGRSEEMCADSNAPPWNHMGIQDGTRQ